MCGEAMEHADSVVEGFCAPTEMPLYSSNATSVMIMVHVAQGLSAVQPTVSVGVGLREHECFVIGGFRISTGQ